MPMVEKVQKYLTKYLVINFQETHVRLFPSTKPVGAFVSKPILNHSLTPIKPAESVIASCAKRGNSFLINVKILHSAGCGAVFF
jgi:hypothetical protein